MFADFADKSLARPDAPPRFEALEGRLLLSAGDAALEAPLLGPGGPAMMAATGAEPQQADFLSPQVIQTIATPQPARRIFVSGNLAYVVGDAGIQIASLSDPRSPQVLANYATANAALSIALVGNIMYVGQSDGMVDVVDVSTPASPHRLGQVDVGASAANLAYLDSGGSAAGRPKRLYVAAMGDGMKVVDVTDPANPAVMNPDNHWAGAPVLDVAFVGSGSNGWSQNSLVAVAGNNVYFINASNPNAIFTISTGNFSAPYDLYADGYKLYIADSTGLSLVWAGLFYRPAVLKHIDTDPGAQAIRPFVDGGVDGQLGFIVELPIGVVIADMGNPDGPKIIGTYENPDARGAFVSGSLMYVACDDDAWRVIDLGLVRDMTVAGDDDAFYYASPSKTLSLPVSINNLGDLASLSGLGMKVSVYLSLDGTLDASDYLLSPTAKENRNLAAHTSLERTLSLKLPKSVAEGDYYLIYKLENGGLADGDSSNNLWVAPAADVRVIKGKPPVTVNLDGASDSGVTPDNVTNAATITLNGITRDNCTVVLKRGRSVLASTTSAADGSFSFDNISLSNGSNSFVISVTDPAGNSATVTKKIIGDTVVGKTTIAMDKASDSGRRGDFLTNIPSIMLLGKTEKNSLVELSVNDSPVDSVLVNSKGAYSFADVVLADGENDVAVTVTDAAGNTYTLHQTITLDTVSLTPTLALAGAFDTGAVGDDITSLSRVSLVGTAEPGSKIVLQVIRDPLTPGQEPRVITLTKATANEDGNFTLTRVPLIAGSNNFTLYSTDPVGNLSWSGLMITLDLLPD